jgi:Lon protease-like protein
VPVFPLPDVVLFPGQLLPLHVFEPRYRAMVSDALAGARLIAIALLKANYEEHYFTLHAPMHRLVGVGRIIDCWKTGDGNFGIVLRGKARARVLEELPGQPYRVARIETAVTHCGATATTRLRRQLYQAIERNPVAADLFERCLSCLFNVPLSLGELTDVIASVLPIDGELRQSMLAELDAGTRARMLLDQIDTLGEVSRQACQAAQPTAWNLN